MQNLNLAYLQPKTKIFVELLLMTTLLQSQVATRERRREQPVREIFVQAKDHAPLLRGLRVFLSKVVRKTDVAGSAAEKAALAWACRVAVDTLSELNVSAPAVD